MIIIAEYYWLFFILLGGYLAVCVECHTVWRATYKTTLWAIISLLNLVIRSLTFTVRILNWLLGYRETEPAVKRPLKPRPETVRFRTVKGQPGETPYIEIPEEDLEKILNNPDIRVSNKN